MEVKRETYLEYITCYRVVNKRYYLIQGTESLLTSNRFSINYWELYNKNEDKIGRSLWYLNYYLIETTWVIIWR